MRRPFLPIGIGFFGVGVPLVVAAFLASSRLEAIIEVVAAILFFALGAAILSVKGESSKGGERR